MCPPDSSARAPNKSGVTQSGSCVSGGERFRPPTNAALDQREACARRSIPSQARRSVFDWVSSNRVTRFLKSQGYRYVHAGSWYWPTASSPLADRTINPYNTVPLAAMRLLDSELITPLRRVAPTPLLDARVQQWHRVREQIDDIVAHAADPGPTLTFLHVLVPHSP